MTDNNNSKNIITINEENDPEMTKFADALKSALQGEVSVSDIMSKALPDLLVNVTHLHNKIEDKDDSEYGDLILELEQIVGTNGTQQYTRSLDIELFNLKDDPYLGPIIPIIRDQMDYSIKSSATAGKALEELSKLVTGQDQEICLAMAEYLKVTDGDDLTLNPTHFKHILNMSSTPGYPMSASVYLTDILTYLTEMISESNNVDDSRIEFEDSENKDNEEEYENEENEENENEESNEGDSDSESEIDNNNTCGKVTGIILPDKK